MERLKLSSRMREIPLDESKQKVPSTATLARWSFDGVAKATDGCKVEPDGRCPHGAESWLLVLGMI